MESKQYLKIAAMFQLIIRLTFIMLLVSTNAIVHAQELKDILVAMKQQYKEVDALHVTMEIRVFEKVKDSQPFFTQRAEVIKQGVNYASHYAEVELLVTEKSMLMVDHASKEIVYSARDVKEVEKYMEKMDLTLDSILSFYGTPKFIEKVGQVEQYNLIQKSGPVKQVDLYLDTQTLLIKKLAYHYREGGQYAVIDFLTFDLHPQIDSQRFDEGQFIKKEKGKMKAVAALSGYTVTVNNQNPTY